MPGRHHFIINGSWGWKPMLEAIELLCFRLWNPAGQMTNIWTATQSPLTFLWRCALPSASSRPVPNDKKRTRRRETHKYCSPFWEGYSIAELALSHALSPSSLLHFIISQKDKFSLHLLIFSLYFTISKTFLFSLVSHSVWPFGEWSISHCWLQIYLTTHKFHNLHISARVPWICCSSHIPPHSLLCAEVWLSCSIRLIASSHKSDHISHRTSGSWFHLLRIKNKKT